MNSEILKTLQSIDENLKALRRAHAPSIAEQAEDQKAYEQQVEDWLNPSDEESK